MGRKTKSNYKTWIDSDPKKTVTNTMNNKDRKRLGLPIDEELENEEHS